MRPGYVEGGTHDYVRHGTNTLFASLDVTTGEVISQCKPRHRQQGFLGFLRQIENSVPGDLDENLIVNNYCSKNHAKVRAWLAQQPSFHVHYTPTSSGAKASAALAGGSPQCCVVVGHHQSAHHGGGVWLYLHLVIDIWSRLPGLRPACRKY